ncbi:MAG: pyridoxamine 5'-phosphate oxidase family protein [Sporichthyaceae bacterium]
MTLIDDSEQGVLHALDRDAALRLMATQPVARLAFSLHGIPHIEVVNFVIDGRDPVFRIGVSSKLAALGRGEHFAMQVDHLDPMTRSGWTVTVIGPVHPVSAEDTTRLGGVLVPWAAGERTHIVRLTARQVIGRVLGSFRQDERA